MQDTVKLIEVFQAAATQLLYFFNTIFAGRDDGLFFNVDFAMQNTYLVLSLSFAAQNQLRKILSKFELIIAFE